MLNKVRCSGGFMEEGEGVWVFDPPLRPKVVI